MKDTPKTPAALEQLLRRGDIWRGHSRTFIPQEVIPSGFVECDKALLNGGWPKGSLLECCTLHDTFTAEWLLFCPTIRALCEKQKEGFLILLNPPAIPLASALIQNGVPLNQLLVVESKNKQDFIAGFIEFTRSSHCLTLLAWQTPYSLNYTELRKCQLACAEGRALYTLFRPNYARKQSSPAPLRIALELGDTELEVEIFKQRGLFNKRCIAIQFAKTSEGDNYAPQFGAAATTSTTSS